jgi:hypothetical protein
MITQATEIRGGCTCCDGGSAGDRD